MDEDSTASAAAAAAAHLLIVFGRLQSVCLADGIREQDTKVSGTAGRVS